MKHKLITTIVFAALFLISINSAFAVGNPDINGVWILDKTKSENLPPDMDQQIMTVKQTGDEISIETKTVVGKDEKTDSKTYKLDGKEADYSESLKYTVTTSSPDGDETTEATKTVKGRQMAKRTADGVEIIRTSVLGAPDGDNTVKVTRKLALSADGKMLKVTVIVQGATVNSETKLAFNKK